MRKISDPNHEYRSSNKQANNGNNFNNIIDQDSLEIEDKNDTVITTTITALSPADKQSAAFLAANAERSYKSSLLPYLN